MAVCFILTINLSDTLQYAADMPTTGRLRSSISGHLDVRPSRLVTVGDHSFFTAALRLWNIFPATSSLHSASSLTIFRRKLKLHFQQSYPDVILQ